MSKVVIFGGGTGLSNILKGLKSEEIDLTVVVTVSDNGGSTGTIRKNYEIPAPGDLRRAVVALSDVDNIDELMNYRFDKKLQNHTVGNIMLTALVDLEGNISKAVKAYCKLLGVKQNILPVTNENVDLNAIMTNGKTIVGETEITSSPLRIREIFYKDAAVVNEDVIKAIEEADAIVFSSGSLYTSIISNILFDSLTEKIRASKAKKIYVANLMTQTGETDGFNVHDHVNEINKYLKGDVLEYCLLNTNYDIDSFILDKYIGEKSFFVKKLHNQEGIKYIEDDLIYVDSNSHARHDYRKIANYIRLILRGEYE